MSYAGDRSVSGMSAGSIDSHEVSILASSGEEVDDGVPIVIIPVDSYSDKDKDSPTNNNGWCKKRTVILALGIPFVIACTIRVYIDYYRIELPTPHLTQRIIDVNSPPVELPTGETIATLMDSKAHQHHQDKVVRGGGVTSANPKSLARAAANKLEEKPIPIVVDRGEVPLGVGVTKVTAADALLCRGSVINYVINATNGKDECTGLQKAFDETCSQEDEAVEIPKPIQQKHQQQDEHEILLVKDKEPNGGGLHRERRRLMTRQKQKRKRKSRNALEDLPYAIQDFRHKVTMDLYWLQDLIGISRPKFLAENEVFRFFFKAKRRERVKDRRRHSRRLEDVPLPQPKVAKRAGAKHAGAETASLTEEATAGEDEVEKDSQEETTKIGGGGGGESNEEDDDDDDDEVDGNVEDDDDLTNNKNKTSADEVKATEPPVIAHQKPHTILSLPTGRAHVSAKTLEKTLLLQQEDKVLSQVKKAVNTTNTTKVVNEEMEDAKKDADASAKAVADTSDLVSAVLNDPTSIEARACCASILNVYHENCNVDAEEEMSDKRLFIVVLIMAFCGMVKSLIRHFKIKWLPEAAGCILVGVGAGYASSYFPHQDFSFDGNWFLRILVPPIVFEAALSIDKKSFNRHLVPIIIYSTIGTLFATFLTASMVYNGTHWLGRFCETIPYIESLIFGSLISSIDPVAVLSVLSNMGMTDTDTLYVLVFGESLLNDGVAIVLFHTLVEFLDANVIIDSEAICNAVIHFFVVALGSVLVGIGSGIMCTLYYWAFHGCQTPLVEVLMFLCWALLPYYVCDGIGWSGIVSSVTVGFVMDMYVIGLRDDKEDDSEHSHGGTTEFFEAEKRPERLGSRPIFSGEGHLSPEARIHIHFVTEIVATMMETAIFAYLGLFLFSHRYHWNLFHVVVSILACCLSRAIMIPMLSSFANWITSMQKYQNKCRGIHKNSPATGVIVDRKMQMVLWFAGLRGAMSFALVEHIPLFDAVTGEGTRVKAELKAMTSASIMFTVFVLGGSTNYFMDYVGLAPRLGKSLLASNKDMAPLLSNGRKKELNGNGGLNSSNPHHIHVDMDSSTSKMKARQRRSKDDPER